MEIIYCSDGNARFAKIAIDAGMLYGAQLPNTIYFPPYFADQNWKRPDRKRYMAALAQYRPQLATVLDWEQPEQFCEIMDWAEEAAQWVQTVIIIPKVQGGIPPIPRRVGGADVRLGYSVPTRFGGTELPIWEFAGWPVHLLGGSPHAQLRLRHYMQVESADGNYARMKASLYNEVWSCGKWHKLDERVDNDRPYKAFELSCHNIMAAWRS